MEWLPDLVKRCLQQQAQMILGRFSPEGRDMSRALRQWQYVAKDAHRRKEKMGHAMLTMTPEGRAMKKGFGTWFEYAKALRERKNKVKSALARMTPEGRAMYAGMGGFKARSPCWLPGPNRHVSEDGFWVISTLQKERESVYGTPEIQRGIFRFGFRINGSGAGLVVGVADATNRLMPAADCRAWGLHLSHGALYTKRQQSNKGVLSTKQLVPSLAPESPDEDPEAMAAYGNFLENVMDIEVEVDMDRRRIAFGLPGGPLVQAPVKLPAKVRPWAYLWNDTDSVMLDNRFQGSRNARQARTLVERANPSAKPPAPLRSRSDVRTHFAAGPDIPQRLGPRVPSHAELGDYLPPYAYTDRTAEDHRAAVMSARPRSPGIGIRSARQAIGMATGGKRTGAREGDMRTPERMPRGSGDPASPDSTSMLSPGKSPLAMSIRSARSRTPASPRSPRGRGTTHMWDMVRYVSGVYSDVYKQI